MKNRMAIASALLLLLPGTAHAEHHVLKFVRQIGVGGQLDRPSWVSFVAFSADGRMIASDAPATPGDLSRDLTIWSFPSGELLKRLPVQPETISQDWQYYAGFHEGGLEVGRLESGQTLIAMGKDVGAPLAFSPDGRYLAVSPAAPSDAQIRVVRLDTGKEISAFGKHGPASLAIGPDDRTLASGHWDLVTLWDMQTGQRSSALRGFGRYVVGMSFSRDGRLLAAGTDTGEIQIWDVRHRKRLHRLAIGGGTTSIPAFSPDGRLVAVGIYGTGAVWLIDARRGKLLDHQKVSDLGCGSVAFSPDGRLLITPSTGGLVTWPYDRGGTIRVFKIDAPRG